MFAKLFESEKYGQILVKKDSDDEGKPEIRFFVEPPNLGVCSIALSWPDDDSGWDKQESAFDNIVDQEFSEKLAGGMYDQCSELGIHPE